LVEISPYSDPPVCKILDYDKYRYELKKRDKESLKKQKSHVMKEIWFRPRTTEHDYNIKLKHVKEFLEDGHKVKITMKFKGREVSHLDFAKQIFEKLKEDLKDFGNIEFTSNLEGKNMVIIFAPKTEKKQKGTE
jgi:translation initiation factor IF-3